MDQQTGLGVATQSPKMKSQTELQIQTHVRRNDGTIAPSESCCCRGVSENLNTNAGSALPTVLLWRAPGMPNAGMADSEQLVDVPMLEQRREFPYSTNPAIGDKQPESVMTMGWTCKVR